MTDLAGNEDIRQEVHLDLDDAFTPAGFAAAALDIERESSGHVAPRLGLGQRGEEFPDRGEQSGVGGGIRAWRAADRALIDLDHLVEVFGAFERVVGARFGFCPVKFLGQARIERVGD